MYKIRFEIQRRYFNNEEVIKNPNSKVFGKWSEWKPYYELSSSSQLSIIMDTFNKNKENNKILFDYRVINKYPQINGNDGR